MHRASLVVVGLAGCGRLDFANQTDAMTDAAPVARYDMSASIHSGSSMLVVTPLDGTGFGASCPAVAIAEDQVFMLGHPTMPYVYGMGQDLHGFTVACGTTATTATNVGLSVRQAPRIALDVADGIGFFGTDGSANLGLFRVALAADGTPTLLDGVDVANGSSGSVAVEPAQHLVTTLGGGAPGQLIAYPLAGAALAFGSPGAAIDSCNVPRDVVFSGSHIVVFCEAAILSHTFANTTIGPGTAVSTTGVEYSAALPGGRFVVATQNTGLAILTLVDGAPTLTAGPNPGTIAALAASSDGAIAVAAVPSAAAGMSTLIAWQIAGEQLVELDRQQVTGTITGLAVTIAE